MAPRHSLTALGKFASDELMKLAEGCESAHELAVRLGISVEALRKRIARLRARGFTVPTFAPPANTTTTRPVELVDSAAPVKRWPSVEEFDADPTDSDEPEPPPGYHVKGKSTLYKDGEVVLEWVKTSKDADQRVEMLLEAMSKIADKWTGLAEPVEPPEISDDDLLVAYGMGDPHIGMFAWAPETGANHDLAIAERDLYTAVDHLVDVAPAAKHGLIVNAGDFFHADNRGNTTTGGTPVDSDGRWPKVLATGVRLMRRCIDRALTKHDDVTVINEIGNHDWHTSIMLATCLAQFYEREPRVKIDTSPSKFHWYRFGKNLIATTHGDTVKIMALAEIMATDRPEDWGETLYRYWITGHEHHERVKELRGCIVRTLRALVPGDAWHRGQGYRSGQGMCAMVFHREWGQINEHTVGIAQVRAAQR